MLEQIKIGISDTSWQRRAACAPGYRPPPGWDALRQGADGSDGAWSGSGATFGATRPPRPVDSHLSRCEPAKERKDTNIVSSQVDERRGHSLLEAAVGRWEPCYRQTIWASFDVWYHVWVNLCLQQGSSTGRPTRSIIQLGFSSPGRPGRRTPSGQNLQHTWSTFRSTRPEHCCHVRNKRVDRERQPQNSFKSILNSSFRQGWPWGEDEQVFFLHLFTGTALNFKSEPVCLFAVFANVSRAFAYKADQNSADEDDIYPWHHHITRVLWRQTVMIQRLTLSLCCVNGSCRSGSSWRQTCNHSPASLHYKRALQVWLC